jgi:hypothetical protein
MRYVARRTAKGDFDQLLYGLARQSELEQAKQIVVLGDGAAWIWKLASEHFPEAVQIVDLSHAQEHVWQVARAAYGPWPPRVGPKTPVSCLCTATLKNWSPPSLPCPPLLPSLGRVAVCQKKRLTTLPPMPSACGILRFEHRGCMSAVASLKRDVKTVVATRLKRSGMRWTPAGLDALLPLRTCVLNHTYDAFWEGQPPLVA